MNKERSESLNRIQKTVISVAVTVIIKILLIGFVLIGTCGSTTGGGYGDNAGITFNPFQYFSRHGIEWSIAFC